MDSSPNHRIRSFVRREGRLTPGQRRNLERFWPCFGMRATGAPIDWPAEFGRDAARTLEIGFGAGEVLAHLAVNHPGEDFIGIEVYRAGVGRLLGALKTAGAYNTRVFNADAIDVLSARFASASVDNLLLYFPDPWPKKRHHKRRIVQPAFADHVARVLKPGGIWRLATDWANYAEHMRAVLDAHEAFIEAGDHVATQRRPTTRFETRGQRRGHAIFDLAYRRRDSRPV